MTSPLALSSPARYIKGVGPKRAALLSRLGVNRVDDLLFLIPRRYEDRRHLTPLRSTMAGGFATVLARVVGVERKRAQKGNLEIVTALITDGSSFAKAVWFNRRGIEKLLKPGCNVAFYGKVEVRYGWLQIANPEFEILEGEASPEEMGKIVPVYPSTEGLNQRWIRRKVREVLEQFLPSIEDPLPQSLLVKRNLLPLREALSGIHYPESEDHWRESRTRLAYDELFLLQLGLAMRRKRYERDHKAPRLLWSGPLQVAFLKNLPFSLTSAQERVLGEIGSDVERDVPMNRLLQGDVGSGKTLIAIASMLSAVDSGYQAALMAPTEVLARQHYIRVEETLGRMGIRCALLTSGFSQQEREVRLKGIASGEIDVIIGTHALIQEDVAFFKLGLVVIDEQHRFGVLQRQALTSKGLHPHVLVMTATPIPRTLAISVYGDLSMSVLDELPPGRKDVATRWVRRKELAKLYDFVRVEAMAGRQIYWVCPVIEESESQSVTSVLERYENLRETFADLRVGLMHGQLKSGDKDEVYEDFVGGKLDILVSTSVIEVGIDVPNATTMVIEDAHRFGLSQLHQLRGRVGRGSHKSYCFLLGEPSTPEGVERLKALCATQSGFDIAESDLRLRGPGEICGTRQHGITDFRVADLLRDASLLEMAREDANELISLDPNLEEFPSLKAKLLASLGEGLSLALTG